MGQTCIYQIVRLKDDGDALTVSLYSIFRKSTLCVDNCFWPITSSEPRGASRPWLKPCSCWKERQKAEPTKGRSTKKTQSTRATLQSITIAAPFRASFCPTSLTPFPSPALHARTHARTRTNKGSSFPLLWHSIDGRVGAASSLQHQRVSE